jgi:hypothetical protein
VGVIASLVGAPSSAWAQSEAPSDPLVASLLTADDLPTGVGPQGIDEPPRFDIDDASFGASGGERAIGQVWTQMETRPFIVFDFRMQLPDAQAAAAYLDAAEPILSEAEASGLAPVMFVEPIGEDGRYYFGVQEVEGSEIQLHNFLFHVGPIAAKVFIAGSDIEEGLPALIAQAAVDRISGSLDGVAAPPMASASPAASQGASASPGPGSSLGASASPGAGASPGAAASAGPVADLLAHIPEAIRATCEPHDPTGTPSAEAACLVDGIEASYALYSNAIAIDGDFRAITAELPAERTSTCGDGVYLGVFRVGGTEDGEIVGQLACWTDHSGATIAASDKRSLVLLVLRERDGDLAALAEHSEFAPIP